ncbi:hypothetical protein MtrunA17_Chr7g0219971 [Medicago truncatula]|uniref:Uncharacterized protein n=1 Tax=Medicago truncatula TaxID=3880 RepID=A0A396GVM3_MEDTR|nr:hypothetical protein MtrunA17_Chr7g0219971 [Medicago truncatula]
MIYTPVFFYSCALLPSKSEYHFHCRLPSPLLQTPISSFYSKLKFNPSLRIILKNPQKFPYCNFASNLTLISFKYISFYYHPDLDLVCHRHSFRISIVIFDTGVKFSWSETVVFSSHLNISKTS